MVSLNAINDRASDPGFVIKLLPNEGTHRRMNEGFMCEGQDKVIFAVAMLSDELGSKV